MVSAMISRYCVEFAKRFVPIPSILGKLLRLFSGIVSGIRYYRFMPGIEMPSTCLASRGRAICGRNAQRCCR
jgi:hypothetical protein